MAYDELRYLYSDPRLSTYCRLPTVDCMPTAEAKVHPQHASSCVLRQRPRHAEQDANDERMSLASLGNRGSGAVAAGRPAASQARSTMILLAIVEHGTIICVDSPLEWF